VLVAGAIDPRVRAVVANVPFVGSPQDAVEAPVDAFAALEAGVRGAVIDRATMVGPVAVVLQSGEEEGALLPQSESSEWFLAVGGKPGARWRNEVWLPANERFAAFNPALAVPHLRGAVLFVAALGDRLTPPEDIARARALAGERGELLSVDGHHFTAYAGEPLRQVAAATIEFLERTL